MTAILPCPFCGHTDAFVERLCGTSSYVQCAAEIEPNSHCLARGPIAVQESDDEEMPGEAGAIAAWNAWVIPAPGSRLHSVITALERLVQAIEYTPLGVRGIKAVEHAQRVLSPTEETP